MAPNIRVGKYILKRKIGEGAFAVVRYAIHEETREEYAVKVFDRANLAKADFERDVKREVKIMQHLRHPNIVSIHAVLVTTSKMYLVMELVRGGELYDEIVSRRRIDEDTSRKYFQQLVDAVIYCHRRGVVHRDLKPENLLLDENGNLKVTDFGMSAMKDKIDPDAKTKQLFRTQCGTPKYMAPEIIVRPNNGYDGEKLDAWECGMVLYALLAGYLPFSGDDDDSVFRSILKGTVKFPSFFSAGVKDLLLDLLQKDPEKRASLEEVRQHPWFQINYFGNESTNQVQTKQSSDFKLNSLNSGTNSVPEILTNSHNTDNLDSKVEPSTALETSGSPRPDEVPRATHSAASRRPPVMRLNLADIHTDPFDTELREVEVPETPISAGNPHFHVRSSISRDQRLSPMQMASPVDGNGSQRISAAATPSRKTKVRDPMKGNVFAGRLSFSGVPRSSGSNDDRSDHEGPVSIRDRFIASHFGAAIRSIRDGFSPRKNRTNMGIGSNVPKSPPFTEESPTSVTATSSISPVSESNRKAPPTCAKESQALNRKTVKEYQRNLGDEE